MALNPNIFNILAQRPKSVADFDNEYAQQQGNQLALQRNALALKSGEMDMAGRQRAMQEQDAFRNALSQPGFDPNKPESMNTLLRVSPKLAQEFAAGQLDLQKTRSEIGNKDATTKGLTLDQNIKAHEFQIQKLGSVSTPQEAMAWAEESHRAGVFSDEQYQRGIQALQQAAQSPQTFAQWKQRALQGGMSATEQLKAQHAQAQLAETARGHDLTHKAALSGQAVTMRGQNMTDARSREANSAGKVPAGYRQKPDGTLEFIPGGPADPNAAKRAAPTEFQGKSAIFGTRAEEADRILSDLTGKYSPMAVNAKQAAGKVWGVGGALEAGANLMLPPEAQKVEQAQRDFVNAVLRQESGAAIADSEFNNAIKQYFPQPGDGKDVIAQKAANRKLVIEGFKNNAGRAMDGMPSQPAASAPGGATGSWADDSDPLGLR